MWLIRSIPFCLSELYNKGMDWITFGLIIITIAMLSIFIQNWRNKFNLEEYTESLYVKLTDKIINGHLIDRLHKTRENYTRLKAREKNRPNYKNKEIIEDWRDYLLAISSLNTAINILNVDFEDTAYENYEENIRDAEATADELERKFQIKLAS